MPWDSGTFAAVSTGLRQAAAEGKFVPRKWFEQIEKNGDGGYGVVACGWGHVAWLAGVFHGGADFALNFLSVHATQTEVNEVLKAVGLTRAEIKVMDPQDTWEHFDRKLAAAYKARETNPNRFIEVSMNMAEFFIRVLQRVPLAEVAPERTAQVRSSVVAALLGMFPSKAKKLVPELA